MAAEAAMRALITRPREDSEALAHALDERGIASVIEPMLTIIPTGGAPDLSAVQALLFTSANGVRAFAAVESRRDLPVFAVGDTSADAAHDAGFGAVESAGGDASALATLVAGSCEPESGPLLHVAGDAVAGDLAGDLARSGFDTRRAVLYRAEAADTLSPDTRRLLADSGFDMALFFSPRTAQTFVILIKEAGLADACRAMTAVCLSPAAAEAVGDGIEWRAVRTATRPEMAALLAEIDAEAARSTPENYVAKPLESEESEPANSAPRRAGESAPRRAANTIAWGLVGFLIVITAAGGGYISWPVWGPDLPGWLRTGLAPVMEAGRNPALVRRVSGIEARLGKFETELAAARKSFTEGSRTQALKPWAETAALDRRLKALAAELDKLVADSAKRIAALEARIASPLTSSSPASPGTDTALDRLRADNRRLGDSVARLARKLAMMTSTPPSGAPGPGGLSAAEGALLLAVGQLREALRGPHPYARELALVRALAGRDPAVAGAVAALAPRAKRGIPDLAMLRARFDRVARGIAQAAIAPKGAGWIDRILRRLSKVVTIRRVGEPVPSATGPTARVARAELRLAADDLAGAVAALGGLVGAPAEAATAWRTDAAARLKADAALATLTARAIAVFGGAPAAGGAAGG